MKRILIILLVIFIFVSCGETEEESIAEETGRIINDYADTLEESVKDARAVKELLEGSNSKLEVTLNNIK